jgi:hypothetical protein
MRLKRIFQSAAAACALAMGLVGSASAATIVHVGTFPPLDPYFYLTSGTPLSPVITANFGSTILGSSVPFDDIFEFTIPQNGFGSGSLSTSFTSAKDKLTITDVIINGVSHSPVAMAGGQSFTGNGIPISSGVLNMIEIVGTTGAAAVAATYSGTMTFDASAIPEAASWMMMIGGFAVTGAMLRRRRALTAA